MSLLDTAKKTVIVTRKQREIGVDHIELVLAWLKGEVTLKQCEVAEGQKNFEGRASLYLKEAYRAGRISIK